MTLTLFRNPAGHSQPRPIVLSLSDDERLNLIAACLLAESNLASDARLCADLSQPDVSLYLLRTRDQITCIKARLLDAEKI
jgi:hypothetical protein